MNSILLVIQFIILFCHGIYGQISVCSHCNIEQVKSENPYKAYGIENGKYCIIDELKCHSSNSSTSAVVQNNKTKIKELEKPKENSTQSAKSVTNNNEQNNNNNSTNSNNNNINNNGNNNNNNSVDLNIVLCPDCEILATDENGEFWGFLHKENKSCKIDTVLCEKNVTRRLEIPLRKGNDGTTICQTCVRDESLDNIKDSLMWSTENGEKCRIITSLCPNQKLSKHPICAGCIVSGTGTDYCLFGYEDNQPCIINEVLCGIPDTRFRKYYSDGTMVGGEGFDDDDDESIGYSLNYKHSLFLPITFIIILFKLI
eukprot:jgi/Orpsp1_1/1183374/evm.model.c7180000084896.1